MGPPQCHLLITSYLSGHHRLLSLFASSLTPPAHPPPCLSMVTVRLLPCLSAIYKGKSELPSGRNARPFMQALHVCLASSRPTINSPELILAVSPEYAMPAHASEPLCLLFLPTCLYTFCSSKLRHNIFQKPSLIPAGHLKHSAHSPATYCTCLHHGNYLGVLWTSMVVVWAKG